MTAPREPTPVTRPASAIVGRERQLVAIDAFLAAPWPRVLLVEGPAGIGKTTIVEADVRRAAEGGAASLVSTTLPGSRTCFYLPHGVAGGGWWIDTLTGDLKLEAVAPDGVRLTLAYQHTAEDATPADSDLAFLVPLMQTALSRLP